MDIEKVKKELAELPILTTTWTGQGFSQRLNEHDIEAICQLFEPPTRKLGTKGYHDVEKFYKEEYKPLGDDPMTEKEEERFNEILGQLGKKPDDSDREGEEETRKSLAEGHGVTFPNAQEAIEWLQSKPDKSRLLTNEEITGAVYGVKYRDSAIEPDLMGKCDRVAKAQAAKTASIKDAENKELGLLLKSRVAGIDECYERNEQGLRRFREKILPIIRKHCLKLAKQERIK